MPRDIPVGNGSLLVNFDQHYQIRDFYWPYVGKENHTAGHAFRFGVWVDNQFRWIDDPDWQRSLGYLEDTLVTHVALTHPGLAVRITCNDLVDFHENLYLRKMVVRNEMDHAREMRLFFGHNFSVSGIELGDSVYYEPERRAVFHYKGSRWFLANIAKESGKGRAVGIDHWAVGVKNVGDKEGTWRDAEDGVLSGNHVAQGSVDSTVALHLFLPPNGEAVAWHWVCAGEDFVQVARINRRVREKGPQTFLDRTKDYWALWAGKESLKFLDLPQPVCRLCRRSLLILRTQIDNHGAIIAANDFDIAQFGRDTYSYLWPRDGALVAATLVEVGYSEITRRFFAFCHEVITDEGYLLHKYNPDGSLASSWHGWYHDGEKRLPVQEDETALVLWAFWLHFKKFRDVEFVKPHYRGLIVRAANWLCSYREPASGLPLPSWDLWEERYGVHAWTVGAVWAGLQAAVNFTEAFGQHDLAARYRRSAEEIRAAVKKYMWLPEENRYARMIRTRQDGSLEQDMTMDASLVGLWYFGMFSPDDSGVAATMQAMHDHLWVKTDVGGMARYENDYYHQVSQDIRNVPGNPWFICTLWLAQWLIAKADKEADLKEPLELIKWSTSRALPSGVMAEQIHPYRNEPLSVSPLTWSHATLVMTVSELMAKRREIASAQQHDI